MVPPLPLPDLTTLNEFADRMRRVLIFRIVEELTFLVGEIVCASSALSSFGLVVVGGLHSFISSIVELVMSPKDALGMSILMPWKGGMGGTGGILLELRLDIPDRFLRATSPLVPRTELHFLSDKDLLEAGRLGASSTIMLGISPSALCLPLTRFNERFPAEIVARRSLEAKAEEVIRDQAEEGRALALKLLNEPEKDGRLSGSAAVSASTSSLSRSFGSSRVATKEEGSKLTDSA